jgi:hypothetical protein
MIAVRHDRHSSLWDGLWVLAVFALMTVPGFAGQAPVRDGQTVHLKLRNILTTDNVRKGDPIEFEVTEDILVNGHVVIAKGARASGKILDVKGAFKPRDKDAEVVFQFSTVTAADRQELPLRLEPEKQRKGKAKDDEVHEKSPIPGQISRVVGADKGKEYEAYVDGSFMVKTSDVIAASPASPVATQPSTSTPTSSASAPVAPAPPAPEQALGDSSVQFDSAPDGAEIVIDGNLVGNTPSSLRMTPGRHTIEIRLAGYRTWTRTMIVDPESHPSVRGTLIPQ